MRLVLTVLFLLLAFTATALAHESHKGFKYESYCCNGDAQTGDCQMIPTRSVRVTPDGYEVSLAPAIIAWSRGGMSSTGRNARQDGLRMANIISASSRMKTRRAVFMRRTWGIEMAAAGFPRSAAISSREIALSCECSCGFPDRPANSSVLRC